MASASLIIEVHHGLRLNRNFPYERMGRMSKGMTVLNRYFDDVLTEAEFRRAIPTYEAIFEALTGADGLKPSLALTGTFLELALKHSKRLIDLVRSLVDRGAELLATTHYHTILSLSNLSMPEFVDQVMEHRQALKKLFDYDARSFMNTGMIYNDSICRVLSDRFECMIMPGMDRGYGVCKPYGKGGPKLVMVHRELSKDLEERFFDERWSEYPLTADRFCSWLKAMEGHVAISVDIGRIVGRDHEAFARLLSALGSKGVEWLTVSEADEGGIGISVPETKTVSKYDGISAWLGNPMQRICFHRLVSLLPYVKKTGERILLRLYRLVQDGDNFLAMRDGAKGAMECFSAYNSVITDFEGRVAILACRRRMGEAQRYGLVAKS